MLPNEDWEWLLQGSSCVFSVPGMGWRRVRRTFRRGHLSFTERKCSELWAPNVCGIGSRRGWPRTVSTQHMSVFLLVSFRFSHPSHKQLCLKHVLERVEETRHIRHNFCQSFLLDSCSPQRLRARPLSQSSLGSGSGSATYQLGDLKLISILKMEIIIIVHISWGYFGD